jgi:hypothetical protein
MDNIVLLTTKEEALAAGVPEAEFDPTVHLYSETATANPGSVEIVNKETP